MENKPRKTRNVIILSVIILVIIASVAFVLIRVFNAASVIPVAKSIPGLVLYYPFDGNAKDMSANNVNGDVHGAVLSTDRFGQRNSAYYFDGMHYRTDVGHRALKAEKGGLHVTSNNKFV